MRPLVVIVRAVCFEICLFLCLSVVASQMDEWCCCLILVGGAGASDTVGEEAVDVSSLPAVSSCRMVASIPKMVASGTLPVRSCKGYISTPRLWVDRPT